MNAAFSLSMKLHNQFSSNIKNAVYGKIRFITSILLSKIGRSKKKFVNMRKPFKSKPQPRVTEDELEVKTKTYMLTVSSRYVVLLLLACPVTLSSGTFGNRFSFLLILNGRISFFNVVWNCSDLSPIILESILGRRLNKPTHKNK